MTFKLCFVLLVSLRAFAGDTDTPVKLPDPIEVPVEGTLPVPEESPVVPAPDPATVQKIETSIEESVDQVDQMNEDLAKIIALLRAQKGLPAVEPFKAPSEVAAVLRLQQGVVVEPEPALAAPIPALDPLLTPVTPTPVTPPTPPSIP